MKFGIDYTLYNKIKAKFPAQPNTILFVSIVSESIDDLVALAFTEDTLQELEKHVHEHCQALAPYAVIGGFDEIPNTFRFICAEFIQIEDCVTGQILESDLGTYNDDDVDLKAVRRDLKKISNLGALVGNT